MWLPSYGPFQKNAKTNESNPRAPLSGMKAGHSLDTSPGKVELRRDKDWAAVRPVEQRATRLVSEISAF